MMRRRGYGVGSLGNHARLSYQLGDLLSGQMAPYSRFGSLAHLDLHRSSAVEVLRIYTEPARGHLDYGASAKLLPHLFWQAPLTGIEVGSGFAGGSGQ